MNDFSLHQVDLQHLMLIEAVAGYDGVFVIAQWLNIEQQIGGFNVFAGWGPSAIHWEAKSQLSLALQILAPGKSTPARPQ